MSTIVQGNAAEAAVLHKLMAAGINVLLPFGAGLPFDLVAVLPDGQLLRVQVKCGWVRKGCVEFNSHSTDHGNGQRHYRGRADVFAVHVASLDSLFIVPVEDCGLSRGYLRLDAPRNNQRRRVRMAADYSLDRWVDSVREVVAESVGLTGD